MKKNSNKGFTLIELLVVIAIIGILSSVVLASLNTARAKGGDAAVKSNLDNSRAEAAIYYDTNNNYGTAAATAGETSCATANTIFALDTTMANQIAAAKSAGGGITSCMNTTGSTGAWAATAQLKTSTTGFWCVDSSGKSQVETYGTPAATQAYADSVVAGGVCQ